MKTIKPDRYYIGLIITIWLLAGALLYQSFVLAKYTKKLNQLCTWEVVK